jgi:hypothetical protein
MTTVQSINSAASFTLTFTNFITKPQLTISGTTYSNLAFMANFTFTGRYTHTDNKTYEKSIRRTVQVQDINNAVIADFLGKTSENGSNTGYQEVPLNWLRRLLGNNIIDSLRGEIAKTIYEDILPPTATISFREGNAYGGATLSFS